MLIYDAFISYSHAADKPVATALQHVLQKLGKPWYARRALRVFRDDANLAAAPALWEAIQEALALSRTFILLACPEAAASSWVDKEAEYWIAHKGPDTLLIGLTGGMLWWDPIARDFQSRGEPTLPPQLKGRFVKEPRWSDLRSYRGHARPSGPQFIDKAADFAAAIRGLPKEDLWSRELREQRRALTLATSAAAGLLVFGAAAAWQWSVAASQRNRAQQNLAAATDMANELVMEVAVKLRNRLGIPVTLARQILSRARDLLVKISQSGEISPQLRREIAVALRELATTLLQEGEAKMALAAAEQSRAIMIELTAEDAKNPQWKRELAHSHNRVGEALSRDGRRSEALAAFHAAHRIRNQLAELDADNKEWQRDLAVSHERIGDEQFRSDDLDNAHESYRSAFDIRSALAVDGFPDSEWSRDLAVSYEKLGDLMFRIQQFADALAHYEKSHSIREIIAKAAPLKLDAQRELSVSLAKIGDVYRGTGRSGEAIRNYRDSVAIRNRLVDADASNTQAQIDLLVILLNLAEVDDDTPSRLARAREVARRLDIEGKLPEELKKKAHRLLQP